MAFAKTINDIMKTDHTNMKINTTTFNNTVLYYFEGQ